MFCYLFLGIHLSSLLLFIQKYTCSFCISDLIQLPNEAKLIFYNLASISQLCFPKIRCLTSLFRVSVSNSCRCVVFHQRFPDASQPSEFPQSHPDACFSLFFLRTTQRLTPPSCEARQTRRVWRASGRVPSMWCRCELGPWLVLANTAARCASKLSQMVRIPEPERSGRPVSLHPPLSHFVSLARTHYEKKE